VGITMAKTPNALAQYAKENDLTQRELGELLGVSRQMAGFLLKGERRITADNAVEWEKTLKIPRERLCPEIFRRTPA